MKILLIVVAVAAILGGFVTFNSLSTTNDITTPIQQAKDVAGALEGKSKTEMSAGMSVVAPGTYTVDAAASTFDWAGKKPLIDGYINSGTIGLASGAITVGESTATSISVAVPTVIKGKIP